MTIYPSLYKKLKQGSALLMLLGIASVASAQKVMTLEQSRRMALQQNNQLRIQNDSIAIAKIGVERAKTHLLPSVDGSATGLFLGKPLSDYLPQRTASASGTVEEVIYAGGKVRNGIKAASLNVDIQQLQQVRSRADVIVRTDSAYWQVVSVKEQIATLKKSRQYLSRALTDANNAYQAGERYKNDVLQVQVQYNQNELQLLRAEDGLKLAKLNLLQVTGMNLKQQFDVLDTVPYHPVVLPPDSSFDNNSNKRPEIRLLQKSVEISDVQTRLATANMLPQVAIAALGLYSNSSTPGVVNLLNTYVANLGSTVSNIANAAPIGIGSNSTEWLALLSVRVPIFHWGDYRKSVQQYELRSHAQRYQLDDGRSKVILDIRRNYNNVVEAEKNVALTNLMIQQSTENLRLSNDRYKAGTITTTDWLQAQTLWQQSYTQSISARVEYNNYITQFKKAIGELE